MRVTDCQNARGRNKVFNKGGVSGTLLKPGVSSVALAAAHGLDARSYLQNFEE